MKTKLPMVALLGFVLIAAAACSGGDDAKIADLEDRVEAAEEARKEAERKAAEEEAARKKAEEEAKKAEEAEAARKKAEAEAEEEREKREAAEEQARQAREAAERRIEEAEQQANTAVRAPLLITELRALAAADVATGAGVGHGPGESRTFTRPLNLPATGSAPRVPGSWSSASYSGPRGNVGTDTVYLYTNIQAPSSKAFWKVHGESVTGITGTDAMAKPSSFGTDRSLYRSSDGTTAEDRDNGSRSGTYDGYSGTFKCSTACNIAADADGALTFTGTWTFTASLTAKRSSRRAEQDTEFLYFGIWAYEPTAAADTPDFKWAASGAGAITADPNFAALRGSATFTGGAIGKYALTKVAGRAAKIGTFTATANFSATFDGADSTISGRITDFKEGGSSLGSGWHVFLGSNASTAATLAAEGASGTLEAHGAIDGDTAEGIWAATLHGSDNADMSAADGYTAAKYPRADVAGVAGWFRANADSNAAIAGAFGAACTSGAMCAK